MSSVLSLVLMAALAAAPVPDVTAQAKQVFSEGQRLYTQGRYQQALSRFEEAYALKPLPLLRYNIARCHERLNAPAAALRAYRDFLRLSPKAPEREAISQTMVGLQKQLRAAGVQQLLVVTEPVAAEVEVDGKPLGPSPASIELPAGEHQVTATLPGYAAASRRIVINTAAMTDLSLVLEAALPPPMVPGPSPGGTGVAAVTTPADAPREAVLTPSTISDGAPPSGEPPPKARPLTWVAGGVAVAALGTGIALGVAASSASAELRDGTVRSLSSQPSAQALYNSASSLRDAANISYAVAGTALAAAVILFFVEGR